MLSREKNQLVGDMIDGLYGSDKEPHLNLSIQGMTVERTEVDQEGKSLVPQGLWEDAWVLEWQTDQFKN